MGYWMKKLISSIVVAFALTVITPVGLVQAATTNSNDYVEQISESGIGHNQAVQSLDCLYVKSAVSTYQIHDGVFVKTNKSVLAQTSYNPNIKVISSLGNTYYQLDDGSFLLADGYNVKVVHMESLLDEPIVLPLYINGSITA